MKIQPYENISYHFGAMKCFYEKYFGTSWEFMGISFGGAVRNGNS